MRVRRRILLPVLAAASLPLAACTGGGSKAAEPSPSASATVQRVTLHVALMRASAPDQVVQAVGQQMQAKYPGVSVKVELLDWTGREDRWQSGLSAKPATIDVLEMGNTDVVTYAAKGMIADLSGDQFPNQSTWIEGMREAGTYDGKLYGVPYFGGARVVWYVKSLWQKAGLPDPQTNPPKTLDELAADAKALMAASSKPNFSGFYLPGKYWTAMMSFVYDAGGSIAELDGGVWKGRLSTPESEKGLANWAGFARAVSKAPADGDDGQQATVVCNGLAGMVYDTGWFNGTVKDTCGQTVAGDLGTFAMPGTTGVMPALLGGSNLAVAEGSAHEKLAADYIKIFTSTQTETALAQTGAIPNTTTLLDKVPAPGSIGAAAAQRTWFTPSSPNWPAVESAKVPQSLGVAIESGGKSIDQAAKDADRQIEDILNR